jgi:hypothetical protein
MKQKLALNLKEHSIIAIIGFIVLYILTIPIRDYSSFFDISQGITIWMHLILIIIGITILLILLALIHAIMKFNR